MKLKDYNLGDTVIIAGTQWQILEHLDNGGAFCIKKDLLNAEPYTYKEFDVKNCNNWKKSSLRAWLNGEYLEELLKKLQTDNDIILNTIQDLTTDDGLKNYGTSTDKVTLLTCDQYRRYWHLFDRVDDRWWLITADSTTNSYICYVDTDRAIYYQHAFSARRVRPACTFNSSIECEKAPIKEKDLIDRNKLIDEIKSYRMTITGLSKKAERGALEEFEKNYKEGILRIIDEQPDC